ncbi:MAG: hypothetical protein H6959_06225 [Chromatiaceae bacterium]|nr:hypothetical protein [Gammaproteobacteria bacterium]MCP5300423.1 hypothetical protein [Chromatiaceae bacterium]MCP5422495.1 hypothetical protein [Chromatiaceae bacterium]
MAKKKAAKAVKRARKRAKKLASANLTLEKRVRKLKRKLGARAQEIADLHSRLARATPVAEAASPVSAAFGDSGGGNVATSQRSAWKRHSYLRDRYEFHIGAGETKDRARLLANEDLKHEHGADSGYTDDELSAILS